MRLCHLSIIFLALLLILPINLYADPYITEPIITQDNDYIYITFRLEEGLTTEDLGNRLVVIERGEEVQIQYEIEFYRESPLWFDEMLTIDGDTNNPIDQIIYQRNLIKQLFFHQYDINSTNNIGEPSTTISFAYNPNLSENVNNLRQYFFNHTLNIRIAKNRIRFIQGEEYYIRVRAEFNGLDATSIVALIDRINFITDWESSDTFEVY